MIASFGTLLAAIVAAAFAAVRKRGGYAIALASLAGFVGAIAGILSFLSLYIYEHPHHRCPFCILKPEYHYQGYWLYVPLVVATAAGLGTGAVQPSARVTSLREIVPLTAGRLAAVAAAGFTLFVVAAGAMVLKSNLKLLGQ